MSNALCCNNNKTSKKKYNHVYYYVTDYKKGKSHIYITMHINDDVYTHL